MCGAASGHPLSAVASATQHAAWEPGISAIINCSTGVSVRGVGFSGLEAMCVLPATFRWSGGRSERSEKEGADFFFQDLPTAATPPPPF